ncbi:condensation domain-containing protein [Mangrovihabitans endophyticus]|uniref:Carrier domain-containing protein n=1 Tax=Mangrovihabitans endophyticus TaxID=1751298 RepID=A0A8J3BUQ1_9ACTN|nr:condensation domain-containing protein [Mangrovihabitans endophyticus]GGK79043.1 hypothetical protein GCM10012284_11270 [Mangrovihabitans endophyticus]
MTGFNQLSPAQLAIWVADELAGADSPFTINRLWTLDGPLDIGALNAALGSVVDRHEALRTAVVTTEGQPWQRVLPDVPVAVEVLSGKAALVRFFTERLDPATPPALRLAVLTGVGTSRQQLALRAHHLLCDGTSLGVVLADLAAAYRPGVTPPRPAPGFQTWWRAQSEELESDRARAVVHRWRDRLTPGRVPVSPPPDRPRPAEPSYRGLGTAFGLSHDMMARLDALAAAYRTTTFTLLLACVHLMVGRSAGVDDVTVGVTTSGRGEGDGEVVGMLAGTAPVRVDLTRAATVEELVRQIRTGLAELLELGTTPFDAVLARLDLSRKDGDHPLFRVIVTHLDERERPALRLGDAAATELPLPAGVPTRARTDVTVELIRTHAGLRCRLELSADRYEVATAAKLSDWLRHIVTDLVEQPGRPLEEYGSPFAPAPVVIAEPAAEVPEEASDAAVDLVVDVWQQVLGRPVIAGQSFFELGGTSHALIRVRALLHRRGYDVPLIRLFSHPTVGSLAAVLDERAAAEGANVD